MVVHLHEHGCFAVNLGLAEGAMRKMKEVVIFKEGLRQLCRLNNKVYASSSWLVRTRQNLLLLAPRLELSSPALQRPLEWWSSSGWSCISRRTALPLRQMNQRLKLAFQMCRFNLHTV